MSDTIVIGGGLSGLAAAWGLEQRGLPYTLIEVKGRLGGSIRSETRAGFTLDGGPFALHKTRDWPWLHDLGLDDALFDLSDETYNQPLVAFKQGTQALVDALARKLDSGRIIHRMAVSSLGTIDERFAVCLENGMLLQAPALIVAAPARYTERMFYSYVPEISDALREFHYDTITRVSLGYRRKQIPLPIIPPPDVGYASGYWTDNPARVPPGHLLLEVGLRWPLDRSTPEALVAHLQQDMGWPQDAAVTQVAYWPESHCLDPHYPGHEAVMAQIDSHLPPGIALIGSDYRALHLEDRVDQGLAAAASIADWLNSRM